MISARQQMQQRECVSEMIDRQQSGVKSCSEPSSTESKKKAQKYDYTKNYGANKRASQSYPLCVLFAELRRSCLLRVHMCELLTGEETSEFSWSAFSLIRQARDRLNRLAAGRQFHLLAEWSQLGIVDRCFVPSCREVHPMGTLLEDVPRKWCVPTRGARETATSTSSSSGPRTALGCLVRQLRRLVAKMFGGG